MSKELIRNSVSKPCAKVIITILEVNYTAKMPHLLPVLLNNVYFQGRCGIISEKRIKFAAKEMRFKYVHDT